MTRIQLLLGDLESEPLAGTLKGLPGCAEGHPLSALGSMNLSLLKGDLPLPVAVLRQSRQDQRRGRSPHTSQRERAPLRLGLRGRARADLRSAVNDMQIAVAKQIALPAGYAVAWSGQFEYLERATERLKLVVPVTLAVIFVLLYLLFRSFGDAALGMAAVPFSLIGGFRLVWALGHSISVATAVGFIALAGVAAEFGVVMLIYLKNSRARRLALGEPDIDETLLSAIRDGAVLHVRPKAMTVAVVMAGLLPILLGTGTGSEVMTRIAAPMVGGTVTAPLLSMLVIPAAWYTHRRRTRKAHPLTPSVNASSQPTLNREPKEFS